LRAGTTDRMLFIIGSMRRSLKVKADVAAILN
jgi:hypothetical protein